MTKAVMSIILVVCTLAFLASALSMYFALQDLDYARALFFLVVTCLNTSGVVNSYRYIKGD